MTPKCYFFLITPLDLGVLLPTLTETVKKMRNSVHLMGLEEKASLHISPIGLLRTVICDTGDREL